MHEPAHGAGPYQTPRAGSQNLSGKALALFSPKGAQTALFETTETRKGPSMDSSFEDSRIDAVNEARWRRPAPKARRLAMALYAWQEPGWLFLIAVMAGLVFMLAAVFAPALLSLTPTVQMISPIADARAIADGAAQLKSNPAPLYALLLLAADFFVDAPGRIHLVAKAMAAAIVVYPFAYLASARFPAAQTVLMTAALAAFVAAPFSGAPEFALSIFLVIGAALLCAPADESIGRARFEGALTGLALAALWLLSPVFSLAAFLVVIAAPITSGRSGLMRNVVAVIVFILIAGGLEFFAHGVNFARAGAVSTILSGGGIAAGESAAALGGVAVSAAVVILAAAVFGGGEHWRGWGAAAMFMVIAAIASRLAGANAAPVFIFAAALACFSVASPFYDGVFRAHDRASVSIAIVAAGLTLFWTASLVLHSAGQFMLQARVAKEAPAEIRAELGLVQPGGPTIATWIEEGRFSTPEARELFALAPVDQSAMLLEAAAKAKSYASYGVDVAILADADAACVLAEKRECHMSGTEAAGEASVVFVPRLDLDPASALAKGKAEALLYTEFKLVEQTALWEIWVRRGATLPAEVAASLATGLQQ